jgi:hypothetical protein
MRLVIPFLIAVLAACAGPAPAPKVAVRLEGEVAQIVRGEGRDQTVLALFHGVHRWAAGDVTGNGDQELVLLWTLPDRPPRVWVIRPEDSGIVPIWRGSGMAGVPLDIGLVPATEAGEILVVLEDWEPGFRLVLYRWDAFGFRGIAWGEVGAGALAATELGLGFLPEGEEQPCSIEVRERQVFLGCPRS